MASDRAFWRFHWFPSCGVKLVIHMEQHMFFWLQAQLYRSLPRAGSIFRFAIRLILCSFIVGLEWTILGNSTSAEVSCNPSPLIPYEMHIAEMHEGSRYLCYIRCMSRRCRKSMRTLDIHWTGPSSTLGPLTGPGVTAGKR